MNIIGNGQQPVKITKEGGLAIRLLNKTGSASVKGTMVETSESVAESFMVSSTDDPDTIGTVYESGIADGALCWVVFTGIAEVLLEDSSIATIGYWARSSITQAGRADITNLDPPVV